MSKFSNFAVSFTIISILSGCLTLYGYGLLHGGPPVMLWGWLLVGTLVIFAGMSLGEICSRLPDRRRPVLLVGQAGARRQRSDLVLVHRLVQPARPGRRHRRHQLRLRLLHLGVLVHPHGQRRPGSSRTPRSSSWRSCSFLQGLLNTFSVRLVALLNDVSVYWHLIGVAIIFVLLFWAPESGTHQSVSFLFGAEGWKAFEGLSGFTLRAVRVPHRPPERAVHVHRLRRLGARLRGDRQRAHLGAQGHRQLHLDLHGRRLHPAARREHGDPDRLPGDHQRRRVHRLRRHRRRPRAVGDDLRVRHRPHHRPAARS